MLVKYKFIITDIFPGLKNNSKTLIKNKQKTKNKKTYSGEDKALDQRSWVEDSDPCSDPCTKEHLRFYISHLFSQPLLSYL